MDPDNNTRADIPIDAVTYETYQWKPGTPELFSRAEVMRQTGAYEAAVPARIANWSPRLTSEDAADIEDATRRLVDFDTHSQRILGPEHTALGPMSAILLRTESASSSQIEQLTASAKQIALAEIADTRKPNARTVVGNVRAMEAALAQATLFNEASVLAIHETLMRHQEGFAPDQAGTFRREQVWIGPGGAGPLRATFVPPHHKHVAGCMADLIGFITREDLPVLAQAAVAHAQFETIHPFTDGNGRTGRAIVHTIVKNKALINSTIIPLSGGLLTQLEDYFSALDAFRSGDAAPIIRAFAQAARFAVASGTELVDNLHLELQKSREALAGVRKDSVAWRALPVFIGQPVMNAAFLMNVLAVNEVTALRALNTLSERGVITELTGRARNRIWQHRGILGVLDDYAAMIRRQARH